MNSCDKCLHKEMCGDYTPYNLSICNHFLKAKTSTKFIAAELRPCYADGKKALFHQWYVKELPIIKIDSLHRESSTYVERVLRIFERKSVLPFDADVRFVKNAVGIVEFEDGLVAEIETKKIQFCDNKIKEFYFGGGKNEQT